MPRKIAPKNLNVVQSIIYNETGLTKSPYRQNLRILNSLVRSKDTHFERVWHTSSKTPITFSDGKIYMNNYTTCLALCGKDSHPSPLYRLPKSTKTKRFEDLLIYTAPINRTPLPREDFKPFFITLTADNWLIRFDNNTGKVLQEIYLGPTQRFAFRHIDWQTQGETILLQSTLFPGVSNVPNSKRVVQAMAIFSVFPLKFHSLFEIDQSSFGKEVNTANVSEGLLILGVGSSNTGKIRIYNLYDVLDESNRLFEATIGSKCDDLGGGKVGHFPYGLPLNFKIKKVPPVLFEVKCSEQILHFGGYPWHYVTSPPKTRGVFELRNVETNKLVENGRFDIPNDTTEPDSLTFHLDDTGRLVYESAHSVCFYKLTDKQINNTKNCQKIVEKQCELKVERDSDAKTQENGPIPSREASKNAVYSTIERTVLTDDFENELEFYSLLGIEKKNNKRFNGKIIMYDNEYGTLVKEIYLNMNLDETVDYNLIMDLDTFVITSKKTNKFECYLYRMTRNSDNSLYQNGHDDADNRTLDINIQTPTKRRRKARKYY